jgi:UDP-N-acetylmuramoylalanine--D-glutamate ligase
LNITPNHLDRHPSMKQYAAAKRAVADYQDANGKAIMSLDNDLTRTIGHQLGHHTRWFSLEAQMPNGAALVDNNIALLDAEGTLQPVISKSDVQLRGEHNLNNVLAACLLAHEAEVSIDAMRQAVTDFTGVEHRLQWVRERDGVSYYNDSIATSPERLIAALRSFDEPVVLLAGGRDKHLPWDEAARAMMQKARQVILFGEATEIIARAIEKARQRSSARQLPADGPALHRCVNMEEAIHLAAQVANSGDVVVLSPGCASYDAFNDFAERGEMFKEFVLQL